MSRTLSLVLALALTITLALATGPAQAGVLAQHRSEARLDRAERRLERSSHRIERLEREVAAQLLAPPDPEHLEDLLRRHAHQSERRERLNAEVEVRTALAGEAELGVPTLDPVAEGGR